MSGANPKHPSNRNSSSHPEIEALEGRRLLSADLAGVFASQLPADIKPGNVNRVAVEVVNDGNSTAVGPVTVDLYADPVSGGSNVLLGEMTRRMNLKPERGGIFNFRFAEPAGQAGGSYNLVADISTAKVNDAITTNDIVTSSAPVKMEQTFTDVATKSVKAPAQSIVVNVREKQQPASITIENYGNVTARGQVGITFYVSTNKILDANAVQAGKMLASINLKPGQLKTLRSLIGTPASLTSGKYYVFGVTNPVNGNVQSLAGHGIGIASSKVQVTVISKVYVRLPRICYSGPDYECTPGDVGGIVCTEEPVDNPEPVASTPVDPGPVDPGPVDTGPVDPGPVDPGPVDPGPVDPDPVDPGPVDPGPVDPGPVDPGPVDPGPVDPGPVDTGPVDTGPVDTGPVDTGPVDDGSTDSGSIDTRSTDDSSGDTSSDDGSGGDYSEQDFIGRRSAKAASLKVHNVSTQHLSHPLPSTKVHVIGHRPPERPVTRGRR